MCSFIFPAIPFKKAAVERVSQKSMQIAFGPAFSQILPGSRLLGSTTNSSRLRTAQKVFWRSEHSSGRFQSCVRAEDINRRSLLLVKWEFLDRHVRGTRRCGHALGLGVNPTDCRCQILGIYAFQHVSARPLCQRPLTFDVGFEGGQNDEPCARKLSP